jgi:predicted ATPase/class 3 adenylate cyclase
MQNSAENRKKSHKGAERAHRHSLPTGTVTFVFTDIEGSTRLLARLRDRYADVLETHHRTLRAAVAAHGGREVHTEGDAFFVAFERASDAVAATVDVQRGLAACDWPEGVDLRVRIGVHTGEAQVRADDYVGIDVHRAARICAVAHGGQVLVSSATHELIAGELDGAIGVRDAGEHRLKDLDRPEHLFQLVGDGLRDDFPPVRSLPPTGALPAAPNSTVGRDGDIRAIARRMVADGARLVTLTGPGGVGKTRLAVEAARAMQDGYADGARFVSLAAVERHEDVAQAIVTALGVVVLDGEVAARAASRFLAAKEMLVVLDNLEHVLGAAPFAAELLAACPGVAVLATSREPLALRAELRHPVEPLAAADAATLFAERARAHDPSFEPDADAEHVDEICRRVDGLPLAIELTAARATLLSPAEIAARLDGALHASAGHARDAPARQQTLWTTIDWSHDLLDDDERACFARFAVFAGGATVDAAEAVLGADLDTFARLVDKSLLVRGAATDGSTRLLMLETVRAYAAERLAGLLDADDVRARHHAFFLALAERHGNNRALGGLGAQAHLTALDADSDNLAAALAWATERRDAKRALELIGALRWYWLRRNRYADAAQWVDSALALPGAEAHPLLRARALSLEGRCLWPLGRVADQEAALSAATAAALESGDEVAISDAFQARSARALDAEKIAQAAAYADEALAHAQAGRDGWSIALASLARAVASQTLDELRARTEEAVELLEQHGNAHGVADLLSSATYAALCLGGDREARAFVERALPVARALDAPYLWMMVKGNLGLAALLTGDTERARGAFREELALSRELVVLAFAHECLSGLAAVAAVDGDDDRAARLLGAARALRLDDHVDPLQERLAARFFEPARARHGVGAWDAGMRQGRAMSSADAFAYGLEEREA